MYRIYSHIPYTFILVKSILEIGYQSDDYLRKQQYVLHSHKNMYIYNHSISYLS